MNNTTITELVREWRTNLHRWGPSQDAWENMMEHCSAKMKNFDAVENVKSNTNYAARFFTADETIIADILLRGNW